MNRLAEKVALVTGGAGGIGNAIVKRFLEEGARVVSCGRSPRPEQLTDEVQWVQTDLAQLSDVKRLRDSIETTFGALHVLVNNAGVQIEKTVAKTTDADWDLLMGINAKGVFLCCRELLPLLTRDGGSIINIGSISGNLADPKMALYNASKAFVHGLTRSIAVDHGPEGVRCNAICPGWIATAMTEAGFDLARDPAAARRDALARHSVGRFGEPRDIANAALWLASDESSFATGQTFVIDGGLTSVSPLNPSLF